MAMTDAIEGQVGPLWFHYSLAEDVLYLRRSSLRDQELFGEEEAEGIVLRTAEGTVGGVDIVNFWQRYGEGDPRQQSLHALENTIEAHLPHLAA